MANVAGIYKDKGWDLSKINLITGYVNWKKNIFIIWTFKKYGLSGKGRGGTYLNKSTLHDEVLLQQFKGMCHLERFKYQGENVYI